jgi:hypothetical protein
LLADKSVVGGVLGILLFYEVAISHRESNSFAKTTRKFNATF